MKQLGFITDENINEIAILNSYYYQFEHNSELALVLMVTRRCNFRCAYCYEEYSDMDMSYNVYKNIIKYIINRIENDGFKTIFLSFFGGEPTLKANEIIHFMTELHKLNKNLARPAIIYGMITTNGYLLTPNVIDHFIDNNILRYQVTVDGFENEHNQSRYLINGGGTWKQIIRNLNYFKKVDNQNLSVLIRTNVSPVIYKSIDKWLNYLAINFSDSSIYKMHFEPAKNFGKMNDDSFELFDPTDEIRIIQEIVIKSKKLNLPLELIAFKTLPFSLVCYAARHNAYIIEYDGTIKKCTSSPLDLQENIVGKLTGDGLYTDFTQMAQWTSYELSPQCLECDILALCYRRKCVISKDFSQPACDYLRKSYYMGLEYSYM